MTLTGLARFEIKTQTNLSEDPSEMSRDFWAYFDVIDKTLWKF
jgi:hypothetical protein